MRLGCSLFDQFEKSDGGMSIGAGAGEFQARVEQILRDQSEASFEDFQSEVGLIWIHHDAAVGARGQEEVADGVVHR